MTEIANLLTEQGLGMGLLVISLFVNGWLGRALLKEKDGRREDIATMARASWESEQRLSDAITFIKERVNG